MTMLTLIYTMIPVSTIFASLCPMRTWSVTTTTSMLMPVEMQEVNLAAGGMLYQLVVSALSFPPLYPLTLPTRYPYSNLYLLSPTILCCRFSAYIFHYQISLTLSPTHSLLFLDPFLPTSIILTYKTIFGQMLSKYS